MESTLADAAAAALWDRFPLEVLLLGCGTRWRPCWWWRFFELELREEFFRDEDVGVRAAPSPAKGGSKWFLLIRRLPSPWWESDTTNGEISGTLPPVPLLLLIPLLLLLGSMT